MLKLIQSPRITSIFEAEQHVYSIPAAGTMPSRPWTLLTNARRVDLRTQAISLWKHYLDTDGDIVPHASIGVPEFRQMLMQPSGELIIEEL